MFRSNLIIDTKIRCSDLSLFRFICIRVSPFHHYFNIYFLTCLFLLLFINNLLYFCPQLGFFTYYTVTTGHAALAGPVPIDSVFIYRPDKKAEVWRFFTYMFLHAGLVPLFIIYILHVLYKKTFASSFDYLTRCETTVLRWQFTEVIVQLYN